MAHVSWSVFWVCVACPVRTVPRCKYHSTEMAIDTRGEIRIIGVWSEYVVLLEINVVILNLSFIRLKSLSNQ